MKTVTLNTNKQELNFAISAGMQHALCKMLKVLEYLRTCNIFYLINGPQVTLGIFDWHMLKKGSLSYQTIRN